YIWLLSNIGRPINEPAVCSAQVILEDGVSIREIQPQIEEVIAGEFERLDEFCMDLAQGKIGVR
ncbi:MAG: S-adenosylmethionine synthetase, partial [Candidatus Bathyarchaeota archaeon]|nr:S-adenosylmethionine synthetase [Candidatus Bathyarchaeota archaeon]